MRLTLTFTNGANLTKELLQHCCELVDLLRGHCGQVVHHCSQGSKAVSTPAWARRALHPTQHGPVGRSCGS